MASYLRTLADALAVGLQNEESLSAANVSRENWVSVTAEDLSTATVIVVPGDIEVTRVSRQTSQLDVTVNVFVGKRAVTDSAVNAIVDLADSVLSALRRHEWGNALTWPEGSSSPVSISIDTNPDDGLNERNVWRAFFAVTYRIFSQDTSA